MLNVWYLLNTVGEPSTVYSDHGLRHVQDLTQPIQVPFQQNGPYIHKQISNPNVQVPIEAIQRPRFSSRGSFEFPQVTRDLSIAYKVPPNSSQAPQHFPFPMQVSLVPMPKVQFPPVNPEYSAKYSPVDTQPYDANDVPSLRQLQTSDALQIRSHSVGSSQTPRKRLMYSPKSLLKPKTFETPRITASPSRAFSSRSKEEIGKLKQDVLNRFTSEVVRSTSEPDFLVNEISEYYVLYIEYCVERGLVSYEVTEELAKDYVMDRIIVLKQSLTQTRTMYAAFRRSIKRACMMINASRNESSKFTMLPLLNSNSDFRIWYKNISGVPFNRNPMYPENIATPGSHSKIEKLSGHEDHLETEIQNSKPMEKTTPILNQKDRDETPTLTHKDLDVIPASLGKQKSKREVVSKRSSITKSPNNKPSPIDHKKIKKGTAEKVRSPSSETNTPSKKSSTNMRQKEQKANPMREEITHSAVKERLVFRSCISSADRKSLSAPEIFLLEKFDEIDFTGKFPTEFHQINHIKAYICCCGRNGATTFMMNNDILKLFYEEIIEKLNGNVTEDEILEVNDSIEHFSKLKMSPLQDTPNTNLFTILVSKYREQHNVQIQSLKSESPSKDLNSYFESIQKDTLSISRKNKDTMKSVFDRIQQLNDKFSRELDDLIGVLSSTNSTGSSHKKRKLAPSEALEGTHIQDITKRYRNLVFIEPDTLGYLNDTITLEDLVLKHKDLNKLDMGDLSADKVDSLIKFLSEFVDPSINIFKISELCDDYRRLKVLSVSDFSRKLETSPDRLKSKLNKYIRRRKSKYMF